MEVYAQRRAAGFRIENIRSTNKFEHRHYRNFKKQAIKFGKAGQRETARNELFLAGDFELLHVLAAARQQFKTQEDRIKKEEGARDDHHEALSHRRGYCG